MDRQHPAPPPAPEKKKWADNPVFHLLINEFLVVSLILLNSLVLFLDEFPDIHAGYHQVLYRIDMACIFYFMLEATIKIGQLGFKPYINNPWNKFDFLIVVASLPALAQLFMETSE